MSVDLLVELFAKIEPEPDACLSIWLDAEGSLCFGWYGLEVADAQAMLARLQKHLKQPEHAPEPLGRITRH